MKKIVLIYIVFLSFASAVSSQTMDWSGVEKIFGKKGIVKDNIVRFNFPRTDLNVMVGDIKIEAPFALTSWVAFQTMMNNTMVMGDLVLLEDEAVKVIPNLINNGIYITAIHNHLLTEKPKIIYTHIEANGNAEQIAEKIKNALSLTGTPISNPSQSNNRVQVDWSKVEEAIGFTGTKNGDIISFGVPRKEKIKESGMILPPIMGTAISINFQKVGENAIITGDFVLLANEVQPVEEDLTHAGIIVTALHTHMIKEQPKLYFMHFWANDDPVKLASGLKAAIMKTNYAR